LIRRIVPFLAVLLLASFAATAAAGGDKTSNACGVAPYAYAGVEGSAIAHGISAQIGVNQAPDVVDGHVGGWVGLGGPSSGPGGVAEWLQAGFAAFGGDTTAHTTQMYYEVTVAGSSPKYVELAADVQPGEKHEIAVLEMASRKSWWRVWVDDKPVSPPIHLPGSHDAWYPEALAENWHGSTNACNTYSYSFANVALATQSGGVWRPLHPSYTFQDPGYKVVPISSAPRTFLAASRL
jgi:hypothetical protein